MRHRNQKRQSDRPQRIRPRARVNNQALDMETYAILDFDNRDRIIAFGEEIQKR